MYKNRIVITLKNFIVFIIEEWYYNKCESNNGGKLLITNMSLINGYIIEYVIRTNFTFVYPFLHSSVFCTFFFQTDNSYHITKKYRVRTNKRI